MRAFIAAEIARLEKEAGSSKALVRERNRSYLADHPFGSVYGDGDKLIRENEKTLAEAAAMHAEIRMLEQIEPAPYFGRVDFTYEDEGDSEQIYVGLKTLVRDREFLVYDWRAPISSLFYNGELGKASYFAPCGEVKGEITLLRQYEYKNGALLHYWDADLHIDDAVLRGVLSGSAGDEMRPIVYTIQREQNAAIRYAPKKNLAVFGPAGCGKTAVGMHRLAWLLYQAQTGGAPVSTLMCTANEAFRSYVAAVLPALGEAETASFSFAQLFERFLPDFTVEPAMGLSEALLAKDEYRTANVKMLYDPAFAEYLRAQTAEPTVKFRSIRIFDKEALSGAEIERKFRALPGRVPVRARLETTAQWVNDELENYMLIHRKELLQAVLDATERGESYTQRFLQLKKRVLAQSAQMVMGAVPAAPAGLFQRLFAAYHGQTPFLKALSQRFGARQLYYEDAVALLYLTALLGGCRSAFSPTHVLVDEAQDLSLLQHRTLRLLFPGAAFTVLADPNQAVAPAANTCSEQAIAEVYGADVLRMTKSYRSTAEISAYAKRFLPAGAPDYETFARSGEPPAELVVPNAAEQTAAILAREKETEGTVGVLLPTAAAARAFYAALQPLVPGLTLVADENRALGGKMTVLPAVLAKGLEFDCVILPLKKDALPDDRVMYLMATRAMHRLYVVTEDEAAC